MKFTPMTKKQLNYKKALALKMIKCDCHLMAIAPEEVLDLIGEVEYNRRCIARMGYQKHLRKAGTENE